MRTSGTDRVDDPGPDAPGRHAGRPGGESPSRTADRRSVLRAVGGGAAATGLPGLLGGRVRDAEAGSPGPSPRASQGDGGDGGERLCLEPRETGSDRSVACRYSVVDGGEDCPDSVHTPCASVEDPCPFDGRPARIVDTGCSGTLRLSGQFCTTPVEHDTEYFPVPCGDGDPKSVVVSALMLVGLLRADRDAIRTAQGRVPFVDALFGSTLHVVVTDRTSDRSASATVVLGDDGRIERVETAEPDAADYRVSVDRTAAVDVSTADRPVETAIGAYGDGRIRTSRVSGSTVDRAVASVVDVVGRITVSVADTLGL